MRKSKVLPAPSFPEVGEWFDLTVDYNVDPLSIIPGKEVVRQFGRRMWGLIGPKLKGKKKYRVKLIRLKNVTGLGEARERAALQGYRLLDGQASLPFIAKYAIRHCKEEIVFGGNEWRGPAFRRMCLVTTSMSTWDEFHTIGIPTDFEVHAEVYSNVYYENHHLWAVVAKDA